MFMLTKTLKICVQVPQDDSRNAPNKPAEHSVGTQTHDCATSPKGQRYYVVTNPAADTAIQLSDKLFVLGSKED